MDDYFNDKILYINTKVVLIKDNAKRYIKRNCLKSLDIEGKKPSIKARNINDMFLDGKITSAEAIQKIIKIYK